MNEPDWQTMGDPMNDRLPPVRRSGNVADAHDQVIQSSLRGSGIPAEVYGSRGPLPFLTVHCDGSNLTGHATWRGDLYGVGVMCRLCGQWFPSPSDTFDVVPDHKRPDILAMLERGDFG